MKKVSKIIRNIVIILSVLILSLIAFVGIFIEEKGVLKNIVPDFNYGMELDGTRELRYLLKTTEEEKEVYVDDEGRIKGIVPDELLPKEADEAEDLISIDTTVEGESAAEKAAAEKTNLPYKTEKRVIKANPDERTLEDFENTKKIIQTRLGKEKQIEYNIRLDTLSNNELILEVPNDSAYVDYVRFMVERKGKFEMLDNTTREVLMNNSTIKSASAAVGEARDENGNYMSGYSQVYLVVTLTDEGKEIIRNISNNYRETVKEDGSKDTSKVVALEIDGTKILETAFTSEYNNNILQIPLGEPSNVNQDIMIIFEQAELFATLVDTGLLPLEYGLSSDNFIHSPITNDIRVIALIVLAVLFVIVSVIFVIRFKLNGLMAFVINVGYVTLLVLIVKYTSILVTVSSAIALLAGIVLNILFNYMYLNGIKNDLVPKEAFKETFKKVYLAIVPLGIIAIIFTYLGNAVVGSVGTVLFWGILVHVLYSLLVVKGTFTK